MSLDRNALLAAIRARPDEDTPRLALADWCDENGDPERAEFIRLQFEAERHAEYTPERLDIDERVSALLEKNRAAWIARVPDWALDPEWPPEIRDFRRGFLHRIAAKAEDLLAHSDDLFAAAPIRKAEIRVIRDGGIALTSSPALARLSEVELSFAETPIDLPAFLNSPHLSTLNGLSLKLVGPPHPGARFWTSQPMLDDAGAIALAGCPGLSGLTELTLGEGTVEVRGIKALVSSPHLSRLRRLDLESNPVGDDGLIQLAISPLVPQLCDLGLRNTHVSARGFQAFLGARPVQLKRLKLGGGNRFTVGAAGVRALARCEALTGLRELDLTFWEGFRGNVRPIARSPHLSGLRQLDLGLTGLSDESVVELARSPYLRNLRCLDLQNNQIGNRGITALARSPVLGTVTRLELFNNTGIGDAGAESLATSEHVGELRRLGLVSTGLGIDGLRAITNSPRLSQLRDLDVQSAPFGDEGGKLLCDSPHLNRLTRLAVSNCGIGPQMTAALRKRFGPALKI